MHVLDPELGIGSTTIIILYDRIADVNRVSGLDMVKEMSHIEADC